ncbi:unnamed protein product [Spirodela intermedia]|uniref:SET domain-containing protein n=1 Tax=Spirodela intermedia TaxID=51605 RepID=A0A7I8JAA0_SPIIN|nr:unnamed protein product [Spirodela intermedia]CAA6667146.1 unnamed protein product [Spirodela intermedia]
MQNRRRREEEEDGRQWEPVLPWLPPRDLASVSATCRSLRRLSAAVTARRAADASRGLESLPIPFRSPSPASSPPYASFLYTPFPVFLTTAEARRRQRGYDEAASGGGVGGRVSAALLVLREHLPSGRACLRVNIDATAVGNAARFINHSCDGGNLGGVLVRNSGLLLPRLCFFASRDIQVGRSSPLVTGRPRVSTLAGPASVGALIAGNSFLRKRHNIHATFNN